jgi:hypothetical protein
VVAADNSMTRAHHAINGIGKSDRSQSSPGRVRCCRLRFLLWGAVPVSCSAALGRNHRGGAVTLRTRGYRSGAAAAFGLWAELFDGHLRGRSRDEVTRLCGGFVEDLAGLLRTAAGGQCVTGSSCSSLTESNANVAK